MIKNYIKTALRNLNRHKGYAFINITGLAIGMACCVLISLFILRELSYDTYHEKADRIYRLCLDAQLGDNIMQLPISNAPVGPVLEQDYPEVLSAVRVKTRERIPIKYQSQLFYEDGVFWADSSIFEVFTFSMINGDSQNALDRPYTAVLSRNLAEKYFGDEEPVGKMIKVNNRQDYTITGVVEDVPQNSHFTFNMLCSFETLYASGRMDRDTWLNFNLYTYLLLPENYDEEKLEAKFPSLVDQYMGREIKAMGGRIDYFLQPLTRIHLYSHMENEIAPTGDIRNVYVFSVIAFFILLIACINFMNLATARSSLRAREVGMRKVVGARKKELIKQFIGESLVYSFLAMALALILVYWALPYFRSLAGIEFELGFVDMGWMIPGLLGLVVFVGFTAGIYPAVFLSSFHPARVLKGDSKAGRGHSRFRRILVTAQFVISVALIIGTGIIIDQVRYMKKTDVGFDKKGLVVLPIMDSDIRNSLDSIKSRLKAIPGVLSAGASSIVPGGEPDVSPMIPEGYTPEQSVPMERITVDTDFFPVMGIEMARGRNFSKDFRTDEKEAVIINETAVQVFGWENPLGKTIQHSTGSSPGDMKWETRNVIGVVKDFHIKSLHQRVAPLHITSTPYYEWLSVKIRGTGQSETLSRIREAWKTIDPGRPFDYFFLGDTYDSQYRAEEKLGGILTSFSVFTVFVACLGLFGMASFATERRRREIGIRKVLGASVSNVLVLLTKDFVKLVLLANLIAWPLAYFGMRNWLQNFAYRTKIGIGVFLLTGLISILIALLTVSYQSMRAALTDPAQTVKYE
ncbi:MAG: FtsX-like permease family protein [Candidatus Aminicenantes bacterium]|nr:FtsX-like permease family protein [Candidatus Aminicenantes bacterium]